MVWGTPPVPRQKAAPSGRPLRRYWGTPPVPLPEGCALWTPAFPPPRIALLRSQWRGRRGSKKKYWGTPPVLPARRLRPLDARLCSNDHYGERDTNPGGWPRASGATAAEEEVVSCGKTVGRSLGSGPPRRNSGYKTSLQCGRAAGRAECLGRRSRRGGSGRCGGPGGPGAPEVRAGEWAQPIPLLA